jgi:hypothetical protein
MADAGRIRNLPGALAARSGVLSSPMPRHGSCIGRPQTTKRTAEPIAS